MEGYLKAILLLTNLLLSFSAKATGQEADNSCLLFFTVQPPTSIPCNPYQSTLNDRGFSLQCVVHAPKLSTNLPERNFTIEWVRAPPEGSEETIGVATRQQSGFKVENEITPYFYDDSSSPYLGIFATSSLTFDLLRIPREKIAGTYWCQVLVKTLESYSYSVAGRSNSQTVIPVGEEYATKLTHHPPCVQDAAKVVAYHQSDFKCVSDDYIAASPSAPSSSDNGAVLVSSGALAAVAIAGGALFVILLILTLVVVYLCRVVNDRKASNGRGTEINRASVQSADTQEEDYARKASPKPAVITSQPHPTQPHPPLTHPQPQPHPLGYGRQNSSYRLAKQQQKPYLQGDQHTRHHHALNTHHYSNSFSNNDSAILLSGKVKPTAGSSNSMNLS